ncbi:uncharacterized protein [Dermacentor andersoni]|uniref:uncharacterized protein n=1 Tax=Dermacentor andersoni TaxID=34620 RepID=UPI002155957C|nr:uncharacterized protein LOC126524228 [Dermacentor andersoni]
MENAPYHAVKQEKEPRMRSPTKKIQDWLSAKGVAYGQDMVKAELMKLVENTNTGGDQYRVDCIAAASGRLVVHLPLYHWQLNPIKLAWGDVKSFVARENKAFKIQGVEPLACRGMQQVSTEKWTRYVQPALDEEDSMTRVDRIFDDVVDSLELVLVNLGEDTMSSDGTISADEDDLGSSMAGVLLMRWSKNISWTRQKSSPQQEAIQLQKPSDQRHQTWLKAHHRCLSSK